MKRLQPKAFKYRLNPNKEQGIRFAQYAGCARYVFNHALADYLQARENESKLPTYTDAANKLPFMKACEDTKWLKDVHSQVLQQSVMDLYKGIAKFFNERNKNPDIGFPRFKRKGKKESFKYPQSIIVRDNKVYLPKIGWVRFKNSLYILVYQKGSFQVNSLGILTLHGLKAMDSCFNALTNVNRSTGFKNGEPRHPDVFTCINVTA